MKILITGSRKYSNAEELDLTIRATETCCGEKITMLLHGGAMGADTLAENWAQANGIPTTILRPDYSRYHGKQAPLIRNKELVKLADVTLALYVTATRTGGTGHTANETLKAGKPLYEKHPNQELKATTPPPPALLLF